MFKKDDVVRMTKGQHIGLQGPVIESDIVITTFNAPNPVTAFNENLELIEPERTTMRKFTKGDRVKIRQSGSHYYGKEGEVQEVEGGISDISLVALESEGCSEWFSNGYLQLVHPAPKQAPGPFFCFVEGSGGFRQPHETLEQARTEAHRLSQLSANWGKKVYVLGPQSFWQTNATPHTTGTVME